MATMHSLDGIPAVVRGVMEYCDRCVPVAQYCHSCEPEPRALVCDFHDGWWHGWVQGSHGGQKGEAS